MNGGKSMKENIYNNMVRSIFSKGEKKTHSHLIIVNDKDDMEYVKFFVKRDEDIRDIIFNIVSHPTYEIIEIYHYDMNLEKQIQEPRAYHLEPIYNKMVEAYAFASERHKNQKRIDGSPYITHPEKVAQLVAKYFPNHPRINEFKTASYLHDVIEDTHTTIEEIEEHFGKFVAHLVAGVTNDEEMKKKMGKTDYLCYKILNMDEDELNIKLCDRLANILDLNSAPSDFKDKYATETLLIMNYLMSNRVIDSIKREIIKEINDQINQLRKAKILELVAS